MYKTLNSPLSVHLELTSSCNHKCRHCYNFWRSSSDESPAVVLTKELALKIIGQLSESGVFHVILTGGEPLLNMDTLTFVMEELSRRNISFSLNSNASLMTEKRAVALREAGLKTILVSILSYDKETQDFITNRPGSYERIINGIKIAKSNGLRVAVNMVVSKLNLSHVVKTGLFAKELGAFSFSATRVIPPRYIAELVLPEFILNNEEVRSIMCQMVELKDSGLGLESLVPYPVCFFKTPDEIRIFGSRTCSAGKTSCAIGADGSVRACAHDEKKYGSLLVESMSAIWARMSGWRDGSFLPSECRTCPAVARCGGGCRIAAPENSLCAKDPIMHNQGDAYPAVSRKATSLIGIDKKIRVRGKCRFRDDLAIGIINTGGIKNTFVNHDALNLLREVSERQAFTPRQLKVEYSIKMEDSDYLRFLTDLVDKKVLELLE